MKAILFAAGLGTRLAPLTNDRPKALVELNGKPLLYHAIQKIKEAGVEEIIVNVHHFADKMMAYIQSEDWGIPVIVSDERDVLLETGGGILFAKKHLIKSDNFLAYNVDVVSTIDLKEMLNFHKSNKALVTLAVRKRDTQRYFMFDDTMQLAGWKNFATGDEKVSLSSFSNAQPWAFSGIHILSSKIFDLIEETGKFSVVPLYLRLAKTQKLMGYVDSSDFWLDLGKPGQIALAEARLKK